MSGSPLDLESQLLQTSDSLLRELHLLQQEKLRLTVEQFEQQCQNESQELLEKEYAKLDEEYEQGNRTVTHALQEQLLKLAKSQQECAKQIGNYSLLLEDLARKRAVVEANFVEAASTMKSSHERHVGEWKRAANEFIRKSTRAVI